MSGRTIAYIDGFNMYFGMKAKKWSRYYWLNLFKLCTNLLKPGQHLISVKYFTSRVKTPTDKRIRQSQYLKALQITPDIHIMYGKYETSPFICTNCGHRIELQQEKMTDVQLATQLVKDAFQNLFDVALVITGDRDIVPAIEVVKSEMPTKRIIAVFPPMRHCDDLRYACDGYIHVTEDVLKRSLFPDNVCDKVGNSATRPEKWK